MKSYTDLEQSKKLAEFLPIESADMYYCYGMDIHTKKWDYDIVPTIIDVSNQIDIGDIPCWSLTALLNVIPNYELSSEHNHHTCLANVFYGKEQVGWYNNPIDACYKMILKLHKLKLL